MHVATAHDRRSRPRTRPRDDRDARLACACATLIAVALVFLALFLVLPLAAVFAEALRKGVGALLRGAHGAGRAGPRSG